MTAPAATDTNTTLVSYLHVTTRDGARHRRDVPVKVVHANKTYLIIDAQDVEVGITLSGAERIALIEALGGHIMPAGATVARFYDASGSQVGAVRS